MKKTMILLVTILIAGCAALTPYGDQASGVDWRILRNDSTADVRVKRGTAVQLQQSPVLGQVVVDAQSETLGQEERLQLAGVLKEALVRHLAGNETGQSTLNVRLVEPKAPSMALNVVTSLLVIVPLDTGSVTVESELISSSGERIASWREVITGEYLDISGAFSRWGRIHNALEKWAQRCVQQPAWREEGGKT